ncbi:hydroxyacylglutathione hydrolase [Variovorax sp. HJSM1_2]|uniref:hydroxyacylglutathione hydrolase n=1 Tax=Variovorax sp. HJSM1_2 TaxID=3366263 RepID=UPI003BC1A0AB
MNLLPLPAFTDNYIWLLHDGRQALVVDPGESGPVFEALQHLGLQLAAILVTHHHADHVGGVDALRDATGATVYGPAREKIPAPLQALSDGEQIEVLGIKFAVMEVPGHTAGHIAYYAAQAWANGQGAPILFCGDTLFSGGCGRLFEGTPAQMLASLQSFARLPDETRVCCAHEYTLSNLKFAAAVEPANSELARYTAWCVAQRERREPTLPSSIGQEKQVNPFMRTAEATVRSAALAFDAGALSEAAALGALRTWKNQFK